MKGLRHRTAWIMSSDDNTLETCAVPATIKIDSVASV
jgi:hypothetical protein